MLYQILVALLFAAAVNPKCSVGCLKCNRDKECIISDVSNFYRINNATAEKIIRANCKMINIDGTCSLCVSRYYPDVATGGCIAVPLQYVFENCEVYYASNVCGMCAPGFYLRYNKCEHVPEAIRHCLRYDESKLCDQCEQGYLLSIDKQACTAISLIFKCSQYTFISCRRCFYGYVHNPNNYFMTILRSGSSEQRSNLSSYVRTIAKKSSNQTPQLSCQPESTAHCKQFDNGTNTCLSCVFGYYLNYRNICTPYPHEVIENCSHYSNAHICAECKQGYYLENNICVPICTDELINNCVIYDGSANIVKCLKCKADYYLDENTCVKRIFSHGGFIANCVQLSSTSDTCEVCRSCFYLTIDGFECIPNILNCKSYLPTVANYRLLCSVCESGYFIDFISTNSGTMTNCIKGNVPNCDIYVDNSPNTCLVCRNGYLLRSEMCVPHRNIDDCVIYSSTNQNMCESCDKSTSINFVIESVCHEIVQPILNCKKYIGGTIADPVCGECEDGYYLCDNLCEAITIANCKSMNGGLCTSCGRGYAISSARNSCILPLSYMSDQCLTLSTDLKTNTRLINDVGCLICKEKAVPFNYQDLYICTHVNNINQFNRTREGVKNCLKYDKNAECIQCDPDSIQPYLNLSTTPPTCVSNCDNSPDNPYSKMVLKTNMEKVVKGEIYQYNVCLSRFNFVANCLIYAPNINNQGDQICIWCNSQSISVIDLKNVDYSNVDPLATHIKDYIPSAFAMYPSVRCTSIPNIKKMSGKSFTSLPANCMYYQEVSRFNYTCIKCKHQYFGHINSDGFIDRCEYSIGCSLENYHNLDDIWNNLVTCHDCVNENMIPFIAYRSQNISDPIFIGYDNWDSEIVNGTFSNSKGQLQNIQCFNNSYMTFGLNQENYGVVSNCGIGAILVNSNGEGNKNDKFGTFCAACKPGFSATSHDLYPFVKIACTAIPNCSIASSYFNACSSCRTGYILLYNEGVDFTKCLSIPSLLAFKLENCYAAFADDGNSDTANSCAICKTGYGLNEDEYCESYSPAHCPSNQFRFLDAHPSIHWNWSLWLSGNAPGCNKCYGDYVAIQLGSPVNVCMKSAWVSTTVDIMSSDNTNYIPKCKNYAADSFGIHCSICYENYIIGSAQDDNTDRNYCYSRRDLPYCNIASSPTTCISCISQRFGLRKGKCELGNITNCIVYNYDNDQDIISCTQCNDGYFLNTFINSCLPGLIYNCLIFENDHPYRCMVCREGHIGIEIGDENSYCYPKDENLQCSDYSITTDLLGGRFNCLTCKDQSRTLPSPITSSDNQTICLRFSKIPNCWSYDIADTLEASTLQCIECVQHYYLRANTCIVRSNLSSKCNQYSITKDECLECDDTSFLSANKTICEDDPKGIYGCLMYSDETKCIMCKRDRYLFDNKCHAVANKIENCAFYSSNNVCNDCEPGYHISGNSCLKAIANNCTSYFNTYRCASCLPGHVLKEDEGVTNCEPHVSEGCAKIDINPPYPCLACYGNFYLEDGECKLPILIPYCEIYDSNTKCSKCSKGYALSVDMKSCLTSENIQHYIDPLCDDSIILSRATCSRCSPGYFFVNGSCSGSCNNHVRIGCLACDPTVPILCYICSPGYYMNQRGMCVSPSISTFSFDNSISTYRLIWSCIILLALFLV